MYLLDTDHISLMARGGIEGRAIGWRLKQMPHDEVHASIVSFEEQVRGWNSVIAQARLVERQVPVYVELEHIIRFYCRTPTLSFDAKAAAAFGRLRQARVRIGTMDLKIASIALVNDATLITRNLIDFNKVPDLKVEDWSF